MRGTENKSDADIVDLLQKRDQSAIGYLKEKYGKRLLSLALNICGDPRDAEECVSDALYRTWTSIPPHDPRGYLFNFTARIVRSCAIDKVRSSARKCRCAEFVEINEELEQSISAPDSVVDLPRDVNYALPWAIICERCPRRKGRSSFAGTGSVTAWMK